MQNSKKEKVRKKKVNKFEGKIDLSFLDKLDVLPIKL